MLRQISKTYDPWRLGPVQARIASRKGAKSLPDLMDFFLFQSRPIPCLLGGGTTPPFPLDVPGEIWQTIVIPHFAPVDTMQPNQLQVVSLQNRLPVLTTPPWYRQPL